MFASLKTDQPQGSYIACEQQSPGGAFSRCVIYGAQFIHIEQGPSRDRPSALVLNLTPSMRRSQPSLRNTGLLRDISSQTLRAYTSCGCP